ncbi:MAG TPA: peptidoglycan-binding domain-containing protein, partial [Aliidongia sp.]|uniref:peptidoglycan-binding domain-containing protein n=1 Tax=Aliidongia sp. TaxID=1914230 RepID=UPI002DDCB1E3
FLALFALAPTIAFAQAVVPESALNGPTFSLQPKAAQPNRNVLGNSGLQGAPTSIGPRVAPGTPGADIPKQPMSEARAADPILKAYVQSLQEQLPAHGYRPGPVSGRLDPQTEQAIRTYQRDAGITPNARSTWTLKQTLDSVTFARPPVQASRPGGGSGGGRIAYVQQRLAAKGYDAGPADGKLGRRTVTAIKDFQGDRGMPRDGRVSPQLLDLLGRS